MAQSYQTQFGKLVIPGAYSTNTVVDTSTNLGTSGILTLIGEAAGGADFSQEDDIEETCLFGPNQLGDVKTKFISGNLVDAYQAALTPSDDPDITGAPTKILLLKTNPSGKASSAILDQLSATYGTLKDANYGKLGNLIYYTISEVAEVKPTTGSFTYIPNVGTSNLTIRANGGAGLAVNLAANTTPTSFVSTVDGLAGVAATGGVDRAIISAVSGTLAVTATGNNIQLTRSVNWNTTPTAGDTLVIPAASVVAGGSNQNVGAYVITAATSTIISATKLSDAAKPGGVPGTITAPLTVAPQAIVSTANDAVAYSPVTITLEGSTLINGEGKSLEINSLTTGTDLFTRQAFVLATTTAVTWVSVSGTPVLLTSATERSVTLNVSRQFDSLSDSVTAGGDIALKMGYTGTTCAVVITSTTLTTTVAGGSGANLSLNLADYATLADLATYISAQTGYTASVGNSALGQQSPLMLDEGTFAAGTTYGNPTLRLKIDAVDFYESVLTGTAAVTFATASGSIPASGLPLAVSTATYLAGGTTGATTDAIISNALTELRYAKTNFVVPLFSRDASLDIAAALTDSASSYTWSATMAATKNHCLQMSTFKKRKERSAVFGSRSSFATVRDEAANLASARCSLAFADCKELSALTGGIVQFQPWMTAVKAAAMQCAGLNRSIFNKAINSAGGFVYSQADYNSKNEDQEEQAIEAGLLVVGRNEDDTATIFVSDQTTYSKDNNFVYNSMQAMYGQDLIQSTTRTNMSKAYIGKSLAEFDATMALSTLESILDSLRVDFKLIAKSDDAPKGYRKATIKISSQAMAVSVEVKQAVTLKWITIAFTTTQVQQTATQ